MDQFAKNTGIMFPCIFYYISRLFIYSSILDLLKNYLVLLITVAPEIKTNFIWSFCEGQVTLHAPFNGDASPVHEMWNN